MSGKLAGFQRRLANVEKALAATAKQEKLEDCICLPSAEHFGILAFSNKPEESEAEMNQTCPVHGFRHLGHVIAFRVVKPGQKYERCRFDELLEEYYARGTQPVAGRT
jgi:hypothetical protein